MYCNGYWLALRLQTEINTAIASGISFTQGRVFWSSTPGIRNGYDFSYNPNPGMGWDECLGWFFNWCNTISGNNDWSPMYVRWKN